MVDNAEESESELDILHVHAVGVSVPKSYKVPLEINGTRHGNRCQTSEKTWTEELGKPELSSIDLPLEGYPNRPLRVCQVNMKVHGK